MNRSGLRATTLAVTGLLAATTLAACGGSSTTSSSGTGGTAGGGSATVEATQSTGAAAPAATALKNVPVTETATTAPNRTVRLGTAAVVQLTGGDERFASATVTVTKGSPNDLAGMSWLGATPSGTPYYLHVAFVDVGAGPIVPVGQIGLFNARDAAGNNLGKYWRTPLNDLTQCVADPVDLGRFTAKTGDTWSDCTLYVLPDGLSIASVDTIPDVGLTNDGVIWK